MMADANKGSLSFQETTDGVVLTLKPGLQNPYDSVVVLDIPAK
jgi:hypothetical protein